MSDSPLPAAGIPEDGWLHSVATMTPAAALTFLQANGGISADQLVALANAALPAMEGEPTLAAHWLAVAALVQDALVAAARAVPAATSAQMAYARARLFVHQGQLAAAEAALRQAQTHWAQAADDAGFARTLLGLTQILAMQGRYVEAESAARAAIAQLATAHSGAQGEAHAFDLLLQWAGAHHNLATLFLYTERHAAALAEYEAALALLTRHVQTTLSSAAQAAWSVEVAHNELNRATALTFLDQPQAAEAALLRAGVAFADAGEVANRGRVQTNLGRLYLRTGAYATALVAFEQATTDLLGEDAALLALAVPAELIADGDPTAAGAPSLEALRQADELLLEQAMAYLVLNLLPEAIRALTQCEALFRAAAQPYELGQTLYTLALARQRTGEITVAATLLAEAATLFAQLGNDFWRYRTQLAQASLAIRQGELQTAATTLERLSATTAVDTSPTDPLLWDIGGLLELYLLRLRVAIVLRDLQTARTCANALADLLLLPTPVWDDATGTVPPVSDQDEELMAVSLPHYALRYYHLLGRLAHATGATATARANFQRAIRLLERTRALLPIEEMRTAFLDDKTELYADLVLLLLEQAEADPNAVAAAFAAVERARSRALLERLLAATSEAAPATTADETGAKVSELRQRLHWLYNQLLGESGSRRLDTQLSAQLVAEEAALQRLEWQQSTLLQQAQSTDLASFQATLALDQQALVYVILPIAGGPVDDEEVMAFLIDRHTITPYRRLTTTAQLLPALDELRFQLGRAELGSDYLARHQARLLRQLHRVLADLNQQLVAPLRDQLTAPHLLIVPFGPLHSLPFHALWDGEAYLLERQICSYAPSASTVVMQRQRVPEASACYGDTARWAGLAIADAAIPAAQIEVTTIASVFASAQLYLEEAATRQGLTQAAQADVLHLATHGLFRPDNPFFSAIKLADGWINVRELYQLPLQARLVVLSACESGAGVVRGGDEVVGLVRGFLGAGAQAVVASLWNVHDATAVTLMQQFYQALTQVATCSPARALQSAQRQATIEGLHPYYWAPFYVIGD